MGSQLNHDLHQNNLKSTFKLSQNYHKSFGIGSTPPPFLSNVQKKAQKKLPQNLWIQVGPHPLLYNDQKEEVFFFADDFPQIINQNYMDPIEIDNKFPSQQIWTYFVLQSFSKERERLLPNSRFNQNLEGSIFAWLFVCCRDAETIQTRTNTSQS